MEGGINKIPKRVTWPTLTTGKESVLSVPSKIFAKIILNHIKSEINKKLRDEQAGFHSRRGTIRQIFILRNIIEQSIEFGIPILINFSKAFNCKREYLWSILKAYGIPEKVINIIKNLYSISKACILVNGTATKSFTIETGVRQGCVLSGLLFIVIDWIMKKTTKNKTGIQWNFAQLLAAIP